MCRPAGCPGSGSYPRAEQREPDYPRSDNPILLMQGALAPAEGLAIGLTEGKLPR